MAEATPTQTAQKLAAKCDEKGEQAIKLSDTDLSTEDVEAAIDAGTIQIDTFDHDGEDHLYGVPAELRRQFPN